MMKLDLVILFIFISFRSIFSEPIELEEVRIPEHTPIGHLLLTLHSSTSNQRYSYRFVSPNHREIQQYFSLNSSTGQLHIAADIDREKICAHRHTTCRFLLKIFDLFNEKLYHIPILIEDINDHRPLFPYKSSEIELHLSENSPAMQSKLFIQPAYDHDQIDHPNQLKYELKTVDRHFPFRLETNTDSSNRLALLLTESLDRERIDRYQCMLHVIDTAGHEEQLHIVIRVDDVNDQSPSFDRETYSLELSERTPINTTIVQVHATDDDIGLNGKIRYELSDASKSLSNIFAIDHQTGDIRLRSSLDYEQRTSYVFYVQARDLGQEPRSSQALINITVLDENDCPPKIQFRFLPELAYDASKNLIEISENHSMEKFFAQILVSDEDTADRGRVRLWFETIDEQGDNEQAFSLYPIDNSTYFFNRTKKFDFENQQWHRFIFYAQDNDPIKPLQTNQILTIHVLDENDNYPQFLHAFYHLAINENNPINLFLTQIEAFDPDSGENGRLTYEISSNDTSLPFHLDPNTGMLYSSKSFDREQQSQFHFHIIARDHGSPLSLSSKIPIRIDINDLNDNKPIFAENNYEFAIQENSPVPQILGSLRASDPDTNTKLFYSLEHAYLPSKFPFRIDQDGQLFSRESIDREIESTYQFNATVSDQSFQSRVPVKVRILDINDCQPSWQKPSENDTVLIVNKDQMKTNNLIVTLEAIDDDEKINGNGLVNYTIDEISPALNENFLVLTPNGDLLFNGTPTIGRYRLVIRAKDHGQLVQHSSFIQFYLLIGDNQTNGSLFFDLTASKRFESFFQLNSFPTAKRVLFLATFFLSIAIVLAFIVCLILILLCRYRRQKYLYYIKCKAAEAAANRSSDPTMIIVDNRLNNYNENHSSSNSSKLSLEDLHQKRLIDHSSSPLYSGANIYSHQHHNTISPIVKPTQTTSDYYSNSSKHEEDIDESNDEQQRTMMDHQNEWSIEKILYPDWLYKGSITTPMPKKSFNTSTFLDSNPYQSYDTQTSLTISTQGRRTMSSSLTSNVQPSPKQVRFGVQKDCFNQQARSHPHLTATLKQFRTGTVTTILQNDPHDTFI